MRVRPRCFARAAALCSAGLAAPAAAEQLVSEERQFQLTPYLWALALDGNITVKGVKTKPSVTFDEIFDHLDYALMVEGEARKGRIGVYVNAIYADLSDTSKVAGARLRTDAQVARAELTRTTGRALGRSIARRTFGSQSGGGSVRRCPLHLSEHQAQDEGRRA